MNTQALGMAEEMDTVWLPMTLDQALGLLGWTPIYLRCMREDYGSDAAVMVQCVTKKLPASSGRARYAMALTTPQMLYMNVLLRSDYDAMIALEQGN